MFTNTPTLPPGLPSSMLHQNLSCRDFPYSGLTIRSSKNSKLCSVLGLRHVYVSCDGCNQDPVVGLRWRCLNCANYDLCTACYMTDIHDTTHRFERIDKSRAKG